MQTREPPSQLKWPCVHLSFSGSALWTASWGLSVSPHREVSLSQGLKQHDLHHICSTGRKKCRFTLLANQTLPATQTKKKRKRTTPCLSILNPGDQHRESMHTIDQGLTPSTAGWPVRIDSLGMWTGADWNLPGTPSLSIHGVGYCPTCNSQRLSASF